MRKAVVVSVLLLALGFTTAVQAAPVTWNIDPVHSQVGFSVRHFFTKVPGQFTKFSGTIVHDPQKPEASSVKAEIDAATINTQNERRDNHLRSQDFFYVEKHPTITFVSTKVTPAGEGKLKVDGNLTIRGITRPVTLDVAFLGSGPTGNGESRAGFEATTKVNRKDFEIVWNRTLDQGGAMLGDDVEIRLTVEAVNKPEEAPAKKAEAAPSKS
ncbi:MAG TPA: YceI family protein [Planctomycetota bacterium]|nr:YceI family protein [Planctomycetota bacterium]